MRFDRGRPSQNWPCPWLSAWRAIGSSSVSTSTSGHPVRRSRTCCPTAVDSGSKRTTPSCRSGPSGSTRTTVWTSPSNRSSVTTPPTIGYSNESFDHSVWRVPSSPIDRRPASSDRRMTWPGWRWRGYGRTASRRRLETTSSRPTRHNSTGSFRVSASSRRAPGGSVRRSKATSITGWGSGRRRVLGTSVRAAR